MIGVGWKHWCWVLMGALFVESLSAQIRIIPRATLDSVAHPTTVADSPMRFADAGSIRFGTLDEDAAPWSGSIRWHNEGKTPLVITRVTTSCGCLRAEVERRPVTADEEATIRVTYSPKGHPGVVYQRLFVYTNLSAAHPTAIVTVEGVVTPSKSLSAGYPHAMGPLRLRTKEIRLGAGDGEVRVACRNVGTKSLRIELDTLLSENGWLLMSEPLLLEAGAEGDVVIRRSGATQPKKGGEVHLYVRGIAVAPRERMLTLYTE